MDIEGLSLDQLHELQGAIIKEARRRIKEARRRIKEAESIVNGRPVARKSHGNAGHTFGVTRFPDDEFIKACEDGLTPSATAMLLGCSKDLVYKKARKLGLEFSPAKAGRHRVSH